MTDDHHLIRLYDFLHEEIHHLDVVFLADFGECRQEQLVIRFGQVNAGKQIGDDALEERDVVRQKLG